MALSTAQRVQTDRLPKGHEHDLKKLEKLTPEQLRARVNITGVLWGRRVAVTYSKENDYTAAQKEAIAQGLHAGDKWAYKVAEIVSAGPSLEQRVAKLEK